MSAFASVYSWIMLGALVAAAAVPLFTLAGVVALSRSRKRGLQNTKLVGEVGTAETTLEPEGAVLVRGELWRARSASGEAVARHKRVRVKGARGHLLIVEAVGLGDEG